MNKVVNPCASEKTHLDLCESIVSLINEGASSFSLYALPWIGHIFHF
jgi:hypothetical protein